MMRSVPLPLQHYHSVFIFTTQLKVIVTKPAMYFQIKILHKCLFPSCTALAQSVEMSKKTILFCVCNARIDINIRINGFYAFHLIGLSYLSSAIVNCHSFNNNVMTATVSFRRSLDNELYSFYCALEGTLSRRHRLSQTSMTVGTGVVRRH